MTKAKIISEICRCVETALNEQLADGEYQELAKGSVAFRLDLVNKPKRHFVRVDLAQKKTESETEPKLEIRFTRKYRRREGLAVPAGMVN